MPLINTDLAGRKFGRWTALERVPRNTAAKSRSALWLCRCLCGVEKIVNAQSLRTGRSLSCGCLATELRREQAAKMRAAKNTHGYYGSPTHRSWHAMLSRCTYPSVNGYENYGGRGITVCERWKKFENFLADMGERPPGTTIERKDNDQGYLPGNCRWATNKEQRRNCRQNRLITFNGRTMCVADWADLIGVGIGVLQNRLVKGWTIERALTQPERKHDTHSS